MGSLVRLPLLLAVTAVSISASPMGPLESARGPTALAEAIAAHNRAPEVTSVFRLYEAEPETTLDIATSSGPLRFKIKETKCQKQAETQNVKKCPFKNSGVVKECTATTYTTLGSNTLTFSCDTINEQTPVRRPRQAKQCTTKNKKQVCKGKRPNPRPGKFGPLSPANL